MLGDDLNAAQEAVQDVQRVSFGGGGHGGLLRGGGGCGPVRRDPAPLTVTCQAMRGGAVSSSGVPNRW